MYVQVCVYLIEQAHGSGCGRNDVVDEEEERVFSSQVNPFPDQEVKLTHCNNTQD